MTLRSKIVALVLGLTTLVLGGLAAFLWLSFEGWSAEAVDRELQGRATVIAALVELEDGRHAQLEAEEHAEALQDPAHPYRVVGPSGELGASRSPVAWPRLPAHARASAFETVIDPAGRAWRVVTAPFQVGDDDGPRVVVQVAGAVAAFGALEGPYQRGLLAALVVALLAGGLGATALAHGALAPLRRLAGEVDAIGVASLDRRVQLAGLDDELRRVASAFNGLLGRLEGAMQQQRQFVSRASHSLRTPVATIRTRAEVALRREREPAAYREALAEIAAASAEASGLITHLLTLARLDEQRGVLDREEVRLAPVAAEVARLLAPRAVELGVSLEQQVPPELKVLANRPALRELLEALLDNALHYTPRGGRAGVGAGVEGGRVALRVWDTGPGIPAEERARVFERFYRGAGAQAAGLPGSGLGLAIVQAIAEAHGANVTLGDREGGGLEVTVAFPAP